MRRYSPIFLLLVSIAAYGLLIGGVWENRAQVRSETPAGYIIPSKFSRILALGHQGLLSDFLFLKTATFFGGRTGAGKTLNQEDWQYVVRSLDVVTDLDPYFKDPYVLAEGLLAWDAGMPEEANRLLLKGTKYRTEDWRLPFYIGFNYFYFLKDYEAASEFIITASRLPGSPGYLKALGARLAYYGGKSKTALLFLKEMLSDTDDSMLKKFLSTRLLALENAVLIEDALDKFIEKHGKAPDELEVLITEGYLKDLPPDPYGGEWVVLKNGRVFSTSKFSAGPPKKSLDHNSDLQ